MLTPLGWLERVPSFKERLRDMSERDVANLGLLGYPVLQTADIAIVRGASCRWGRTRWRTSS